MVACFPIDAKSKQPLRNTMKILLLALFALTSALNLRADSLLQNGDFSAGGAHWQGDGQIFAANTLAPGAFGSKGMVVLLKPDSWTKIFQQFQGDKGTVYSITVTYRVSLDLVPSENPADYADVNKRIGLDGYENFGHMNLPPGHFFGTIGDATSTRVAWEVYVPQFLSSDVQTYQHTYPAISANRNNVAALGFPPGKGSVNILSVAVTSQ